MARRCGVPQTETVSTAAGWIAAVTPWLTGLGGLAVIVLGLGSKTVGAWMDARRSAAAAARRYRTEQEDARITDLTQDNVYLQKRVGHLTKEQDRAWWLARHHLVWDHHVASRLRHLDPDTPIPPPPPLLPHDTSSTPDQEETPTWDGTDPSQGLPRPPKSPPT